MKQKLEALLRGWLGADAPVIYLIFTSAFAGFFVARAFPPTPSPIGFLGLILLIDTLYRASSVRKACLIGYVFGFTFFTISNNWIAEAFTYQAKMPAFLGWLAVPMLSLYLAIFPAISAALAKLIARKFTGLLPFLLIFAATWIIGEWMRGWVFTGFPWNPLSLMLLGDDGEQGIAALLPWMGTYALSGAAVFIAGLFTFGVNGRGKYALPLFAIILLFAMQYQGPKAENSAIPYTLVQPNIPQTQLNDPRYFETHFQRLAQLSQSSKPRLLLWPESAIPDYLEEGYPQGYYNQMTAAADPIFARRRIGQIVGPGGLLLSGAVNLDFAHGELGGELIGARNSVSAISGDGGFAAKPYNKAHLVPYGEYLPMRGLLEPLGAARLVEGSIDFIPGPGPETRDLGRFGKAGMQICYEIIFSGQVTDPKQRPDYIFNPTNDGWFGEWGPPQHLAQARMRALEEGIPVLRATTTGISAVIDARGRIVQQIESDKAGSVSGFIPKALPPTLFSRLGNILTLIWAGVFLLLSFLASRRQQGYGAKNNT